MDAANMNYQLVISPVSHEQRIWHISDDAYASRAEKARENLKYSQTYQAKQKKVANLLGLSTRETRIVLTSFKENDYTLKHENAEIPSTSLGKGYIALAADTEYNQAIVLPCFRD